MPSPVASLSVGCAVATYVLVNFEPHFVRYGASYLGIFLPLWVFSMAFYAVYFVILWPKYLSPLRHVPSPEVCHEVYDS